MFQNPGWGLSLLNTGLLAVGYGALLVGCVARRGPVRAFFATAALDWLGQASYSFSLVHNLPLRAALRLLPSGPLPGVLWPLTLPIGLAAVIPPTWLLYTLVERRFLRGRQPGRAAVPLKAAPGVTAG